MNELIPNSFQHPNAYVDWLSYYLTPEEERVLNKAIREILGFRDKIADRQARIALSVFVNGKEKNGQIVCMGCGLSLDAVRKALASLHSFNILIKVGAPTNDGQLYELVEDWDAIRWDALRLRREVWDKSNQKRTAAARQALEDKGEQVGGGILSDSSGGYCQTVGPGVLSDSDKETQASFETQKERSALKVPFSPLVDKSYSIEFYYKDKRYVSSIGTVNGGPWAVTCGHCDGTVEISELDVPVGCICGMHEFTLSSKRQGKKVEIHPAVLLAIKKLGASKVNDESRKLIEETVPASDLEFWEKVISGWLTHGWFVSNVAGMIDWYNRREIPHTGKKKGGNSGANRHGDRVSIQGYIPQAAEPEDFYTPDELSRMRESGLLP